MSFILLGTFNVLLFAAKWWFVFDAVSVTVACASEWLLFSSDNELGCTGVGATWFATPTFWWLVNAWFVDVLSVASALGVFCEPLTMFRLVSAFVFCELPGNAWFEPPWTLWSVVKACAPFGFESNKTVPIKVMT